MSHVSNINLKFCGGSSLEKFWGHVPPVPPWFQCLCQSDTTYVRTHTSCARKVEKGYCKVYQNYTGTVLATLHISGQEILSSGIHVQSIFFKHIVWALYKTVQQNRDTSAMLSQYTMLCQNLLLEKSIIIVTNLTRQLMSSKIHCKLVQCAYG